MNSMTSRQYDLEMDYFIIESLDKKNMGYSNLFRLIKEKYNPHISDDTLSRHLKHLTESDWIHKDDKYSPFYLTEKCKQLIKLNTLVLTSPVQRLIEPTSSVQRAIKQIDIYILLLLFKSGSTYKFKSEAELENFLSTFGLSMNSLSVKLFLKESLLYLKIYESDDGKISVQKRDLGPHTSKGISFICNIKGIKFPLSRYRLEPFQKSGISQDEIKESLSLLSIQGVVQEPVIYKNDSIYLITDVTLFDLMLEYGFYYESIKRLLKKIWELRKPTTAEVQWLRRAEGDSVDKVLIKSLIYRQKMDLNKKKKLMNGMKKEIRSFVNGIQSIDQDYAASINRTYYPIVYEIRKIVYPDWISARI